MDFLFKPGFHSNEISFVLNFYNIKSLWLDYMYFILDSRLFESLP